MKVDNPRKPDHDIDPLFTARWSMRSFTGEAIDEESFLTILEAARWAPSAFNIQPWRFVYALRDTEHWPALLGLLNSYNQSWVQHAGALVILVSDRYDRRGEGEPVASHSHAFDTGAAWAYLTLQAYLSGWTACCMTGFDIEAAQASLGVPDGWRVDAAVAIGRSGPQPALSESFVARQRPNDRLPLSQLAMEGRFRPGV